MTTAQARARLQRMVSDGDEPLLTTGEVDDLLALARRPDRNGNTPHQEWDTQAVYTAGEIIEPDTPNGHLYQATTTGVTGTTEPAWPTGAGATIADGAVTWKEIGPVKWRPTYDLNAGAAEGWRWKAGKVVPAYSFTLDRQTSNRSEMYDHCMSQAATYARKVIGSAALGPQVKPWEAIVRGN